MEEETIKVKNSELVLSLDFELNWGVRDVFRDGQYDENLFGVQATLPKLLAFFEKYKYKHMHYAAHTQLAYVGANEQQDPLHFGQSLIERIIHTPHQEIGTHTFSHFYCLENGQTEKDFRADLQATKEISIGQIADIKSLFFFT